MWWLILLELAVTLAVTLAACRFYLHMFQLESYQLDGYNRWLKANRARVLGWTLRTGVIASLIALVFPVVLSLLFTGEVSRSRAIAGMIASAFCLSYGGYNVYVDFTAPQKKPMVFTGRMKRLCAVLSVLCVLALALWLLIFKRDDTANSGYVLTYIPPFALIILAPYLTAAAGFCAQPWENAINHRFFVMAQNKLAARKDLIKIGITGSYGKTSTKFCLAAILSVKYNVLASQSSVNTPMGLSKMINNDLNEKHQVLIAEMGARHVGDIRELVELVHPRYGLLTSVGPQHLETFGSQQAISNTKFELIQGLPKNGCGFFAADDGEVDKLYARAKCAKRRVGFGNGEMDLRVENVEVGGFGSRFTLVNKNGESVRCETKLLGKHNISNIVLCAAAALEIGLTMDEVAEGISRILPIEHRLQVIPGALTVIDDAFNSNPVGAKRALDVLKAFPGRHLIITPGFVELGRDEKKFQFELGTQIAEACDAAILVGPKHTEPIRDGLLKAGFDPNAIRVVKTLDEASKLIRTFIGNGDTVLFENDLPDNYTE